MEINIYINYMKNDFGHSAIFGSFDFLKKEGLIFFFLLQELLIPLNFYFEKNFFFQIIFFSGLLKILKKT